MRSRPVVDRRDRDGANSIARVMLTPVIAFVAKRSRDQPPRERLFRRPYGGPVVKRHGLIAFAQQQPSRRQFCSLVF